MKTSTLLLVVSVCSVIGTGCSPNLKSSTTHLSGAGIIASSAPPAQKSEELAKGAEDLLSAEAFQPASDMTELALKQDPTNLRARFIRAVLGPLLLQRGIVNRVHPISEQNTKILMNVDDISANLSEHADANNANRFFLDGRPEFRSEADVQAHLDATVQALDGLLTFLRENKSTELTVKVPSEFLAKFAARYAITCEVTVNATYEYDLTCPPNATRFAVSLNRADWDILQDATTYYLAQALAAIAYDLSTGVAVADARTKANDNPQAWYDSLIKDERLGRLRRPEAMKRIRGLGLDLIASLRWAMANQSTMCPKGETLPTNRVGMLFNEGLCVPAIYFAPFLDLQEPNLAGTPRNAILAAGTDVYPTRIYWTALLDQPLNDGRQLGPLRFDQLGTIMEVGEPTGGGMFPNGDANKVLSIKNAVVNYK